jgi:hypothetical protein
MPLNRALAKNMVASYFGKKAPYGFVMELQFCTSLFCVMALALYLSTFGFMGLGLRNGKKNSHCGFRVFSNCPQCPLMGSSHAKPMHTILHGQRSIGRDHK